jgi:uncharacterized protein
MFDLRTLRLSVGDSHREPIELALSPFTLGGERYEPLPARVPGELRITRLTSGLLFDLSFSASAFGACQRCLEEARIDVSTDSREYQAHTPEPGGEDEMVTPYLSGEVLDTDRWAQDALLLAMPPKIVCTDDCEGLCPQCGHNRNEGPCGCVVEESDGRWAKLRDLL